MFILVAEDEVGLRTTLVGWLRKEHEVIATEDGAAALLEIEKRAVDLVISDNQMPKLSGFDLLRRTKEVSPSTSFLMMTGFGSIDQGIEAIRLGADDYLLKPFELAEIRHRVHRIEELRVWKAEKTLKQESSENSEFPRLKSAAARHAMDFVEKVANVASPVLLLGPSGAGKEVMARAIHRAGSRAGQPFVAINCASLTEQLMESELFGHEKGAFTGAITAKQGKFELAKDGTLFLDEMGELSLQLQAKLLRVLQEKEFYRLGGLRLIKANTRVVAATNRSLKQMVTAGTFREDLFFRLNVLCFELPPLRERRDDIPTLIHHFWNRLCKNMGSRAQLSPDAFRVLCEYSYPGNIRELQNTLERILVLGGANNDVGIENLPAEVRNTVGGVSAETPVAPDLSALGLIETLEKIERDLVIKALQEGDYSQARAASRLKITRGALQYKIKKYGLSHLDRNSSPLIKKAA